MDKIRGCKSLSQPMLRDSKRAIGEVSELLKTPNNGLSAFLVWARNLTYIITASWITWGDILK